MKWTKLFKTTEQKNEEYRGNDYIEPWISLTEDSTKVAFNKRDINLVSPSVKRTYDGNALTANNIKVVGFWEDVDGATYNVTGIQTLVGTQPNSFEYTLSNETSENDYHITKTVGTLEVTDGTGPGEEPVETRLVITAAASSSGYALGDDVTFNVSATNIYDEPKQITLSTNPGLILETTTFTDVQPGNSVQTTAMYRITESDILSREYVGAFMVDVGNINRTCLSTAIPEAPISHLTIYVETTSVAEDEERGYQLGETIDYSATVLNDGNLTLTNVRLNFNLENRNWMIGSLGPKESSGWTFDYTVQESDVLRGEAFCVVSGRATSPDYYNPDAYVTPGEDPEPTEEAEPYLDVSLITTSEPASDDGYEIGEPIEYEVTVTNSGNLTISGITLTCELTDDEINVGTLSPGSDNTYQLNPYYPTAEDAENGEVVNSVSVIGHDPNGDEVDGADEDGGNPVQAPAKRSIIMTSASDSRSFDGTHLTNDEITISGDGFAPGEGASYDVTGTQYFVGSSENQFTYTLNQNTSASDYVIVTQFGTLTVTDDDVDPGLVLTSVFDDDVYSLGDVVTITFRADNIYNHEETISLSDNSGEITLSQSVYANAAAGYRFTTTGTHEITEADIAAGGFNGTVACYVGNIEAENEINITTEMPDPHLELSITTTSSSQDPDGYAENEEIEYEANIENRGNLTISNIVIHCSLDNLEWTIDSLVPGNTSGWTFSHIVDSDDVANETVVCKITGDGDNDSGEPTIVDPAEIEDVTIQS